MKRSYDSTGKEIKMIGNLVKKKSNGLNEAKQPINLQHTSIAAEGSLYLDVYLMCQYFD